MWSQFVPSLAFTKDCYGCLFTQLPSTLCNPTRLLSPWDFPGKNTGAGCHFLLQGIFPTQGMNSCLLRLLPLQEDSLPLSHREALIKDVFTLIQIRHILCRYVIVLLDVFGSLVSSEEVECPFVGSFYPLLFWSIYLYCLTAYFPELAHDHLPYFWKLE